MKKIILVVFTLLFTVPVFCQETKEYSEDNAAFWYLKAFDELPRFTAGEIQTINRITSKEGFRSLNPMIKSKLDGFKPGKFLEFTEKAKQTAKHCFYEIPENVCKPDDIFFPADFISDSLTTLKGIIWKNLFYDKSEEAAKLCVTYLDFVGAIIQSDSTAEPVLSASKAATGILYVILCAIKDNAPESFKEAVIGSVKEKNNIFSAIDRKQVMENTYKLMLKIFENLDKSPDEALRIYVVSSPQADKNLLMCIRRRKELAKAYDKYRITTDPNYAENNVLKAVDTFMEKDYLSLVFRNDPERYTCPSNGTYTINTYRHFPTKITCTCLESAIKQEQSSKEYLNNTYNSEKEKVLEYFKGNIGLDHSHEYTRMEIMQIAEKHPSLFKDCSLARCLIPSTFQYTMFIWCLNETNTCFKALLSNSSGK